MTLKSNMTAAFTTMFSTTTGFGESVTYNSTSTNAIVRITEHAHGGGSGRGGNRATGDIKIQKADVSSWSHNDTVTIDSVEWDVKGLIKETDVYFHLVIERDVRGLRIRN